MDSWQGWVRNVVVGRKKGIRAAIRRELNVATWLDEEPVDEAPAAAVPELDPGWGRVAAVSELPGEGELLEVFAEDRALVLVRVDGEIHALDSVCPHAGGPLGEGEVAERRIVCPWHGWAFDVRTGTCSVDTELRLETFTVRIDGDDVLVAPSADGA